jgi:hypothetical protein
VLIAEAATDGRELAFADNPDAVIEGWLAAVGAAGVTRVILVGPERPGPPGVQWAVVDPNGRSPAEVATEVAMLDDAREV